MYVCVEEEMEVVEGEMEVVGESWRLWSWYNRHHFVYEETGDQKEQCTQVHLVKNVAELGL